MALSIRENISFTCPSCRNYVLFIPYQDPVGCLKDQFPTCPNCGTALERHKLEIPKGWFMTRECSTKERDNTASRPYVASIWRLEAF